MFGAPAGMGGVVGQWVFDHCWQWGVVIGGRGDVRDGRRVRVLVQFTLQYI